MKASSRPINYLSCIGVFLFTSLVVTIGSLVFMKRQLSAHHKVILDRIHALIPAERLNSSVQAFVASERGFLLTGNPEFLERLQLADKQFKQHLDELSEWIRTTKGEDYFEQIVAAESEHLAAVDKVHELRKQSGLNKGVTQYFENEVYPRRLKLQKLVDSLVRHKEQSLLEVEQEYDRSSARTVMLIILSTGLSILLCSLLCFLFARKLAALFRSAKASEEKITGMAAELSRSNSELERFASIASHDLRSPLTSISNFGQLLERRLKDLGDARSIEYVRYIVEGTSKLRALVDDLLDFARVGNEQRADEWIDLNTLVGDVVNSLNQEITTSHAQIVHEQLPEIMGNRTSLHQLFSNLISNAIRYRSEKDPVITIRATELNDAWQISVKDNGIGIAPDCADQVFEPFKRLHAYHEIPGSGLGLSICRGVVERLGGKIWLDSHPGKGATFTFTIKKVAHRLSTPQPKLKSRRATF